MLTPERKAELRRKWEASNWGSVIVCENDAEANFLVGLAANIGGIDYRRHHPARCLPVVRRVACKPVTSVSPDWMAM